MPALAHQKFLEMRSFSIFFKATRPNSLSRTLHSLSSQRNKILRKMPALAHFDGEKSRHPFETHLETQYRFLKTRTFTQDKPEKKGKLQQMKEMWNEYGLVFLCYWSGLYISMGLPIYAAVHFGGVDGVALLDWAQIKLRGPEAELYDFSWIEPKYVNMLIALEVCIFWSFHFRISKLILCVSDQRAARVGTPAVCGDHHSESCRLVPVSKFLSFCKLPGWKVGWIIFVFLLSGSAFCPPLRSAPRFHVRSGLFCCILVE